MCFGHKKDAGEGEPPRPAQNPQPHASETKASVPPQYHQQPPLYQQSAGHEYAPPTGPPPSQRPPVNMAGDDFAPPPGPPPSQRYQGGDDFAPPPGPPPSQRPPVGMAGDDFAPPPGPLPSHHAQNDLSYMAPPPRPPPSHHAQNDLGYMAPPPGPPPTESKSKHDWESVVPDTSLFPPPPNIFAGFDRSPAHNATEEEAEAGEKWCAQHPLTAPITLDGPAAAALHAHNPRLMQPDTFRGTLVCTASGLWSVATDSHARDSTIIAYPPLYTVTQHSPLSPSNPARQKTVYYEVQLAPHYANPPKGDICVALGFAALPYPSFRMPGWHRGSLAVHGDDGHKFVNDRWGGKSFTEPFAPGERLGIGMTFHRAEAGGRIETDVFVTRQGAEAGRWNLHEETDAEEDLPVTGLEGYHDLSCAVGTSGRTGLEVVFDPARWLFRPAGY
ncbi:hypothetical protein N658DRAFT_524593 [Parathielavia hyrcaniae]|uniref:SPRY domain-containing protein n=1 Tax=Parathielavia hyrcaniae TaxID=113614 RepID=A0AAN6Q1V5_9PEZI|nr:hypothetical protein N658DRAFT_524593 [Parathielavia hyrcaniae]